MFRYQDKTKKFPSVLESRAQIFVSQSQRKNQRGFTLIEILVVIAIIALMASVVIVSFNSARIKARDARRKADMAQLRQAITWYFNEVGEYPAAHANPNKEVDIQLLKEELVPKYITQIPDDPNAAFRNYEYVFGRSGGKITDYGLLVPFGNDGGQDCKFVTPGGQSQWFKQGSVNVPVCAY